MENAKKVGADEKEKEARTMRMIRFNAAARFYLAEKDY